LIDYPDDFVQNSDVFDNFAQKLIIPLRRNIQK